jgi:hypothetical protein
MRLLMITSFAALVASAASLAAVFLMALYIPTQAGTGLPWTTNISRNIGDAPRLATVTFHNDVGGKIWVALQ